MDDNSKILAVSNEKSPKLVAMLCGDILRDSSLIVIGQMYICVQELIAAYIFKQLCVRIPSLWNHHRWLVISLLDLYI